MKTRTSVASLFLMIGCGSSTDTTSGVDASAGAEQVTSAGSCQPAATSTGNDRHVGAFCSPNGGQCGAYANAALQCSVDLDPRGGDFCILLGCQAHSDCGDGACCTGDPGVSVHACVPIDCLVTNGSCPAIP